MATEEIEISQLELAEDLAPDMVLPVETTTDTKATTLQKIKDWLGSFFVGKSGNETIYGNKTFKYDTFFNSKILMDKETPNTQVIHEELISITDKSLETGNIPYNKTYYPFLVNDKNKKLISWVSSSHTATGESACGFSARTIRKDGVQNSGAISVTVKSDGVKAGYAPTPLLKSKSNEIATASWVIDTYKENIIPSVESMVEIVTAISSTDGYIAPNSGFVSVQTNNNGVTTKLYVDGVVVAQAFQYSGDSHGHETKQLFTLVGKGQVVKTDKSVQFGVFVPFK